MAQQFTTTDGTLIIPGAYSTYKIEGNTSGIATTGVLMLVGEAEAGPHWSKEEDLGLNSFGPNQLAEIVAKYKSGALVDAFRGATAAANDPQLAGSFFRAILVKTNDSVAATGSLTNSAGDPWAAVRDRSYGKLGNLIGLVVKAKQAEVVPTTGAFAYIPPTVSSTIDIRVNGLAASVVTAAPPTTPADFRTAGAEFRTSVALNTDLAATGGVDLGIMGTSLSFRAGNLSLALVVGSANTVTVTFTGTFAAVPAAGSTLVIPSTSQIAVAQATCAGSYVVTAATTHTITARKVLDATGAHDALTAPVAAAGPYTTADDDDLFCFSPINISVAAGVALDGIGKTLEISETAGAFSDLAYVIGAAGPAKVSWISKVSAPKVIVSGAEYIAQITASRQLDGVSEDISGGGTVALKLSYTGTSAYMTNDGVQLSFSVVGGAGSAPAPIKLANYPTIGDLATYIGSLTGFKASPGSPIMAQQPSTSLDHPINNVGTLTHITIGSTHGALTGQLKQDAFKLWKTVTNDGFLITLTSQPTAGLPVVHALSYLTGGVKGGTTDLAFAAALDAAEMARGNFVVPLFSRDAVDDLADDLTESDSSYTLAFIHSYTRAHCLKLSTLKRKRNRQAFLSVRTTFPLAKTIAADTAHYRCCMTFQDIKDAGARGIVQFQPWMGAVKAASMQAIAFYRSIVHKGIAISGALQGARDFNDQDDSKMEDALLAGLLPIRRDETGGYIWVSDQTTYGKDANFVFNSIQAVYAADTIALSTALTMERAFVGQSIADTDANLAMMVLEGAMAEMRRLKFISKSDDAPRGFRNAQIRINGPVMLVSLEVKLSGTIYFVPIQLSISQVTQSAG